MAKKETFKEFEKREIAEALAYISNYAKKHPNLLKSAEFPNTAKKFNRKKFAETVDVLMEPFAKAIGKVVTNYKSTTQCENNERTFYRSFIQGLGR